MDLKSEDIKTALELINKHFQTDDSKLEIPFDVIETYNALRENLFKLLRYMLEFKFERLLTGMYRIDVPESKFNEAMESGANLDDIASKLTDIVLEWEIEKVKYRKNIR